MNIQQKIAVTALAVYLLGSIIAFGHAVNHVTIPKLDNGKDNWDGWGIKCVLSAVFWPYYLSTAAFKPAESIKEIEK